jgi:hypothetical protein
MLSPCSSSYSASTNLYFGYVNQSTGSAPKPVENVSAASVSASAPVDTSGGVNILV